MTSYDPEAARGWETDGGFGNPTYDQHFQTQQPQPSTFVAQEVRSLPEGEIPYTRQPLVLSILSSIFCSFFCGAISILLVLLARLKLSDRKLEHARHSLNFARIFLCLSLLFGLLTWVLCGLNLARYFR